MSDDDAQTGPAPTFGRNEKCHCGSGKKYKQCHLRDDEVAARKARAEASEAAAAESEAAEPAEGDEDSRSAAKKRKRKREQPHQPWKRGSQQAGAGHQRTLPRKVGS
jgi:hypothetical protein